MYELSTVAWSIRSSAVSCFFPICWSFLFQVRCRAWRFHAPWTSRPSLVRDVIHLVLQANPCSLKFDQVETLLRDSVCHSSTRRQVLTLSIDLDSRYCQHSWTSHLAFNSAKDLSHSAYRIQYYRKYPLQIRWHQFYIPDPAHRSRDHPTGILIGDVFHSPRICNAVSVLADRWNRKTRLSLSMCRGRCSMSILTVLWCSRGF